LRETISTYSSAFSSKNQRNPTLAALERKKKDPWVSDDPIAILLDASTQWLVSRMATKIEGPHFKEGKQKSMLSSLGSQILLFKVGFA
jgi:ABC-type transport system involved in cytochrome c biogenesis ATPase subunit